MTFEIKSKDKNSNARAGVMHLKHSIIQTPIFMPVGTAASVKSVHQRELENDLKAEIILANTYHLYLRPGMKIINKIKGLHNFMNWHKSILTDSGGYQVFSLINNRKISPEGVQFYSHIDGSKHFISPEKSIEIQRILGSDIMMAFDECTPPEASYNYTKKSIDLTHQWLLRCYDFYNKTLNENNKYQNLFPIVQGSIYKDLRKISVEQILEMDAPGNAIGGVCHPTGHLYEITGYVCELLPMNKPRYLMGVGTPKDILECISLGVDMFDCVMPTRNGRNGCLFTLNGIINIKNSKWKKDFSPIDKELGGYASTHYSKSYLHHLFKSGEILAYQICSLHNLKFYLWLVNEARKRIIAGDFVDWKKRILPIISSKL